jgi:prepilin-type N-terminal cleavage/methylation domain-containing protein
MKNLCRAYTLLELLATVAIVSILLLIATPSYQTFYHHQETNALTQQLTQTFSYARNQAVIRQQIIVVIPQQGNWQNGWSIIIEKTQQILRYFAPPPKNIQLQLVVLRNNNLIRFMPDGTTNGSNGHFSYDNTLLFLIVVDDFILSGNPNALFYYRLHYFFITNLLTATVTNHGITHDWKNC